MKNDSRPSFEGDARGCLCAARERFSCPYRMVDRRESPVSTYGHSSGTLWRTAALFFLLTFASTTYVGQIYSRGSILGGLMFSVPLMTILLCHELGHYLQTRRYGVFSTPPYFIPLPVPPFGTFGAVIQMDVRIPNRRCLFDIGISGPLAGLIVIFPFLVVGLCLSRCVCVEDAPREVFQFGEPLVLRWLSSLILDRPAGGGVLILHPIATAAWTGLFITTLNLFPLSQLDGGHVFYALIGRAARRWMFLIYAAIVVVVIVFEQWQWIVMLLLLCWIGIAHPPTSDDSCRLGWIRMVLGWLVLAFILIGFTPSPISEPLSEPLNLPPMLSHEEPPEGFPLDVYFRSHWSSTPWSDTIPGDTILWDTI